MDFHTDLAIERQEICEHRHSENVRVRQSRKSGAKITEIEILNEAGARELDKPRGTYITVELEAFSHESELLDGRLTALTEAIRSLLPKENCSALIAGLGNESITPDAFGPKTAQGIFVTRHIPKKSAIALGFGALNSVSALIPGVLGQTGMESAELLQEAVKRVQPDVVITVDALAARSTQRLGKTVQLTDTGLTPGSGVGNHRTALNRESLGVPVLAVGVPTVIDTAALLEENTAAPLSADLQARLKSMVVCPREIDTVLKRASRFVALALNCALQPDLSPDTLLAVL